MTILEFQNFIREKFYEPDSKRGTPATFLWFMEEVGELASALAEGNAESKSEEFADVLAWLFTLANINDIDMTEAVNKKYFSGEIKGHK